MSASLHRPPEADSAKRLAILDAATALFIAQGYGAVSMDAIARAASVSKATLYAYFHSKDQLFATIIREACQTNLVVQEFLPEDQEDIHAALTRFANRMLCFLLEDRSLAIHRVVIAESIRFPELGRAFYDSGPRTFTSSFSAWLSQQTAAGRLAIADPVQAADQFAGMLKSGCYNRAALGVAPSPSEAEIDRAAAGVVAAFLRAYAPGPAH
jgi:TetR/AcrR family transcriptional repressor of mexJK operon